jgi:hypothetical protein
MHRIKCNVGKTSERNLGRASVIIIYRLGEGTFVG